MEYEKILMDIGGLSRAQILLFVLLSFTNLKSCLEFQLLALFMHQPKFLCGQAAGNDTGWSVSEDQCTVTAAGGNGTRACSSFVYPVEPGAPLSGSNLVSRYDLVCDRAYLRDLLPPVYFTGTAVGMVFGTLGDRLGRKTIILCFLLLDAVSSPLPALAPNMALQLASRFVKGISSAVYYQSLLLVEELTAERYRSLLGNLFWLFWCAGYMTSGALVAVIGDWRSVQFATLAPCLVYIAIAWAVPESPRWLVLRGRQAEAVAVFRRLASWNGIRLAPDYFAPGGGGGGGGGGAEADEPGELELVVVEKEPTGRLAELFIYPEMRKKTLVVFFMLTAFSFTYHGLSADVEFTTSNIVLNQVYTGLVEIPSSFIGWLLSDYLGRRWPTLAMTLVSGVGVVLVPHVPKATLAGLRTGIALFAKCILTAAYCIMDLYATELLPTSVRNNGLFLATFLATVGNIVAPYTNSLARHGHYLPGLVFGGLTVASSLSLLLLPETRGLPLPETVASAEGIRRGTEAAWLAEQRRLRRDEVAANGDKAAVSDGEGEAAIRLTAKSV
ncbi:hypothetical protein BOX15_Mlig021885g1 [Macrostomum lignano]|uniref:Major facilitator superfamily (MFS) profile domain-containing protein n=2 Tax=Macrostomum lignano TaxID=282301 RepID=A0A267HBI2_9PLAT|nr:hypothetical protein BOX15_Mlig021885g1 [Macrostomum lignano]